MKAVSVSNGKEYECYEPDLKILTVAPNASYYIPLDFCTFILIECNPYSVYVSYKVEDKSYISLGTLPHDKLQVLSKNIAVQKSLNLDEMVLIDEDEDCDD